MIQKVNAPRVGKTAVAPFNPPTSDQTDPDGLPNWGSWRDGKHWKIEIVQQVRARCHLSARPCVPLTIRSSQFALECVVSNVLYARDVARRLNAMPGFGDKVSL